MKTPMTEGGGNLNTMVHKCPKVKLLIDLTAADSNPYFEPARVRALGITYKKIRANFGDRPPSEDAVDEFIETVTEFIRDQEDPEDEIAVVCTYGTNRAGYL